MRPCSPPEAKLRQKPRPTGLVFDGQPDRDFVNFRDDIGGPSVQINGGFAAHASVYGSIGY